MGWWLPRLRGAERDQEAVSHRSSPMRSSRYVARYRVRVGAFDDINPELRLEPPLHLTRRQARERLRRSAEGHPRQVLVAHVSCVSAAYAQYYQETHETHGTGLIRVQLRVPSPLDSTVGRTGADSGIPLSSQVTAWLLPLRGALERTCQPRRSAAPCGGCTPHPLLALRV